MSVPPRPFEPGNGDPALLCRKAHLILKGARPSKRGGSHSEQVCSTDARTAGEDYDRWLVSQ
jgi:hypothetical protein